MVYNMPSDVSGVKYIANLDSNNTPAIPIENWVVVNGIYQRAPITSDGTPQYSIPGNSVVEQHTQTDAVSNKVTFSQTIKYLEIYNTDKVNTGVFTVNGMNITVPPNETFKAQYGGTASATVTVTGSTSYILTRYV